MGNGQWAAQDPGVCVCREGRGCVHITPCRQQADGRYLLLALAPDAAPSS
jgi:hypothetical protein